MCAERNQRNTSWRGVFLSLSVASCAILLVAAVWYVVRPQPRTSAQAKAVRPTLPGHTTPIQRVIQRGVAVEFSMTPVQENGRPDGELREGDDVVFRLNVTDATTGEALPNVRPAAWLTARANGEAKDAKAIVKKVAGFVRGGRDIRPDLDLNAYYVLTLNDDATISVVDPLFGFGGTKLLTLIPLKGVGDDWAITDDHSRLFVSIADVGKVAVINISSWSVVAEIDLGTKAGRIVLQPDEHYLWVAESQANTDSGVAVIDTRTLKPVARIATGLGRHEIAFGPDNALALVTNEGSGTVSAIDVRTLSEVADLETGPDPVSIAYCAAGGAAYVTHGRAGTIAVIDLARRAVSARVRVEAGLGTIKFAPGRRFGFVLNTERNLVHILDAATNRIVQTADMIDHPDQLAFTDQFVYVRQAGSDSVRLIAFDGIGVQGKPVRVVDVTGGQNPLGKVGRPSLADGIVQASGEGGALVANAADKAIYYYEEGMAAPTGSFSNYGREPRALLTVDRSLRQHEPGVYETVARLERPGRYDLAFLVDNPRVVDAFEVTVLPDPVRERAKAHGRIDVERLADRDVLRVGEQTRLRVKLVDRATRSPKVDLRDVTLLTYLPGRWQQRSTAVLDGKGVYEIAFVPPRRGLYYVYVESPSAGLSFGDGQFFTLEARETEE
jgi:YVTN family beta-propeller protein